MKAVWRWLDAHVGAIQALAAILTVVLALGALIGVKLQIDASARIAAAQSARDIYREFLNLSISRPELANPDYCALIGSPQEGAYENYVEYMLYAAEQTIAADANWRPTFQSTMAGHQDYICSIKDWSGYSDEVRAIATEFRAAHCSKVRVCPRN